MSQQAVAAKLARIKFGFVYRELSIPWDAEREEVFKQEHEGWQVPVVLVPCNRIVLALRDRRVPVEVFVENIDSRSDTRDAADGDYFFGCGATVEPKHRMLLPKHSMSLPEYLILLFGYHIVTGRLLGLEACTLLNGSRFVDADNPQVDGAVPTTQIHNGRLQIGTSRPDDRAHNTSLMERRIDFHEML